MPMTHDDLGQEIAWTAITEGMPVYDRSDERIGVAEHVLEVGGIFEGVVIHTRPLPGKHLVADPDQIAEIRERGIVLNVRESALHDPEAEHQRRSRETFNEAGYPTARARLIAGRPGEVLPRLTDGGYDLVFVHAAKPEYPRYLESGVRLLRPGGVIAFDNALCDGRMIDPAHRDPSSTALRALGAMVREDETLVPLMLPVDGGLLLALRTC